MKRTIEYWEPAFERLWLALAILAIALAIPIYIAIHQTKGWTKTTGCVVTDTRVVRDDKPIGPYNQWVALYAGEYRLRYVVDGRNYFVWGRSQLVDKDRAYVENQLRGYSLAECAFVVRYNRKNPAESEARLRTASD